MKYCSKCGTILDENEVVCKSCGAPQQQPLNYQQPYYQQNNGVQAPVCGLAVAGMVLGIVGMFIAFWGIIPIIAVALSGFALSRISSTGERGKGMAIAGLVLGIVGIAWGVLMLVACLPFL